MQKTPITNYKEDMENISKLQSIPGGLQGSIKEIKGRVSSLIYGNPGENMNNLNGKNNEDIIGIINFFEKFGITINKKIKDELFRLLNSSEIINLDRKYLYSLLGLDKLDETKMAKIFEQKNIFDEYFSNLLTRQILKKQIEEVKNGNFVFFEKDKTCSSKFINLSLQEVLTIANNILSGNNFSSGQGTFFNAIIPSDNNFVIKSEKEVDSKGKKEYQRTSILHFDKVRKYLGDFLSGQIVLKEEKNDKIFVVQEKVDIKDMKVLRYQNRKMVMSDLGKCLTNKENRDILLKFISGIESLKEKEKLSLDMIGENIFYRISNGKLEIKIIDTGSFVTSYKNNDEAKKCIEKVDNFLLILKELYYKNIDNNEAESFWKSKLSNEIRIEKPLNSECEVAFVIPIFNEKPERILHQLIMFEKQEGNKNKFEIIYIVNNDIPGSSLGIESKIKANKVIIEEIENYKKSSELNIHIIDKSSPGNEIIGCNVGKARNRGIAEASKRFQENNKNGLIIQTDADSYIEDFYYINKLLAIQEDNSDMIGIAGGISYEVDLDTENKEEKKEILDKLGIFNLRREWHFLNSFLADPEGDFLFKDTTFSGAHMISRSYETALIGGLTDSELAEDVNFGKELKIYSGVKGKKVLGKRGEIFIITAWRESDRTGASFKKTLDSIDLSEKLKGRTYDTPSYKEIKEQFLYRLQNNINNPDGIRKIFKKINGDFFIEENGIEELINYLKTKNVINIEEPFYKDWTSKYLPNGLDPVKDEYNKQYPEEEITPELIKELEEKVKKHPKGIPFIENMRKNLTSQRERKH